MRERRTVEQRATTPTIDGPALPVARAFLTALVAQDFTAVGNTLAPHVHLRALLPRGPREWREVEAVAGRFEQWFGDTEQFDPIGVTLGEVGGRVQLRWRFRLQAARLGPGSFVVEQVAYADVNERAGIAHLDLLCTGYLPESSGA